MFQLQKLFSLFSVTCPIKTRKAQTVPYNALCFHLWDFLSPNECLALWQCQQLNMSVCHASSVVDMLDAQVCPATVENHASYLPVFMMLHIFQTPSPTGSGFQLMQHTSRTKIKTHFILQHITHINQNNFILQSLLWFQLIRHTYGIHS